MDIELKISRHLMKRYAERFSQNKDFLLNAMETTLWHRSFQQKKAIRMLHKEIKDVFKGCKETKSHLNNQNSLLYLYETYGFDTCFHFYHNHHVMFVTAPEDPYILKGITCYDLKEHNSLFGNLTQKKFKKKFNKKKQYYE